MAADHFILEAATGVRTLSETELRQVMVAMAQAGFVPGGQRVAGRLVGQQWEGRTLQRGEWLPADVYHYLKHAVVQQEWPAGTTFAAYLASLREVILDPTSGLLVSQFRDRGWHLTVVRRSGPLRGPHGHAWVMVEYRVETGHWATAFQLREGLAYLESPVRKERRWLRSPG